MRRSGPDRIADPITTWVARTAPQTTRPIPAPHHTDGGPGGASIDQNPTDRPKPLVDPSGFGRFARRARGRGRGPRKAGPLHPWPYSGGRPDGCDSTVCDPAEMLMPHPDVNCRCAISTNRDGQRQPLPKYPQALFPTVSQTSIMASSGMPKIESILVGMRQNPKGVSFADLHRVCAHYFGQPRRKGSHEVFCTPWPGDPRVNIQNSRGMAKAYQVRQVLMAIDRRETSAHDEHHERGTDHAD